MTKYVTIFIIFFVGFVAGAITGQYRVDSYRGMLDESVGQTQQCIDGWKKTTSSLNKCADDLQESLVLLTECKNK